MGMFNKFIVFNVFVAFAFVVNAAMSLDDCKARAADGDAEALWQLGQRYENGDGVRKDMLKAVSQYKKAAEKQHSKACGRLADFYEHGKVVGKDPVKAARYRAMAMGESGEAAAAIAQTAQDRAKVDNIEIALDYIIGRNGHARDAKKGIQLLYEVAKDNPTAQRVFVERWEKGDLDAGLSTLSSDDWQLVLPWFKKWFDKGKCRGGLVLGNDAYKKKRYEEAIAYWKSAGAAGLPKAWYMLGRFYCCNEEDGGGPKSMRSDIKAKTAYEKCLKLDHNYIDAKYDLGVLCILGEEKCIDYSRALGIFSELMKKYPNNISCPYFYGYAGCERAWNRLVSRWPDARVKYLWAQNDKQALTRYEYDELKRYVADLEQVWREEESYMQYVKKSVDKEYEPARKYYDRWLEQRRKRQ